MKHYHSYLKKKWRKQLTDQKKNDQTKYLVLQKEKERLQEVLHDDGDRGDDVLLKNQC